MRVLVWVIDDVFANHELVRRSLPQGFEACGDLESYVASGDALLAIDAGVVPDVVFMDYFLDDRTGDAVTREIRARLRARGLEGPFIVGHSSARGGSLAIVRAGGDVAIEKDRRQAVSQGVRELFPDLDALRAHAGRGARPLSRAGRPSS